MKLPATLLIMILLLVSGCANFPADTTDDRPESPASTESTESKASPEITASTSSPAQQERDAVRERKVQFGNWRVDCIYEEVSLLTQCKAETYSKLTEYRGEDSNHPTPVLWISWLKGDPIHIRSVCVFGHGYPVKGVRLQVDDNPPLQLGAVNAAGCVIADSILIKQLRAGHELNVTFLRWPWGQTIATFSLNKSNNALNELDRLVAGQ